MTATNRLATLGALTGACLLLTSCGDAAEPLAPPEPVAEVSNSALVRTTWPSPQDPGPPAYARIEPAPPHVYNDGVTAAVVFYRNPACIPADFNLLGFFGAPAAFGCTLFVEGQTLWENAPFSGPPAMTRSRGDAVPVWFAPMDAVEAAIADDVLTIGELAGLDGLLMGTADRFHEMLQPIGGPNPVPKLVIGAQGELDDGRDFALQLTSVDGTVQVIRIEIR